MDISVGFFVSDATHGAGALKSAGLKRSGRWPSSRGLSSWGLLKLFAMGITQNSGFVTPSKWVFSPLFFPYLKWNFV